MPTAATREVAPGACNKAEKCAKRDANERPQSAQNDDAESLAPAEAKRLSVQPPNDTVASAATNAPPVMLLDHGGKSQSSKSNVRTMAGLQKSAKPHPEQSLDKETQFSTDRDLERYPSFIAWRP